MLWQSITIIEAQNLLNDLWVENFINLKPEDRKKTHRKMYKQAYPSSFEEAKQLTNDQIKKLLQG